MKNEFNHWSQEDANYVKSKYNIPEGLTERQRERHILDQLKDFDLVTFSYNDSYGEGVYTISRTTEKAILIDDEWLPKSQIVSVSMTKRKRFYPIDGNLEIVIVPELTINGWFDKMTIEKRQRNGKGYGW